MSNANISVTSINCPNESLGGVSNEQASNDSNVRLTIPKIEDNSDNSDSELELSNIEKTATCNVKNTNGQRPMSWEGELSENEEMMEVEKSSPVEMSFEQKTTIKPEVITPTENIINNNPSTVQQLKVPAFNSIASKFPDIVNLKFEPGAASSSAYPEALINNSPLFGTIQTTVALARQPQS